MKHFTAICLIWLISMLFLSSCDEILGEEDAADLELIANFEIILTQTGMTDYGCPCVTILVENTGNATGYNVACRVHAKNASGVIIDSGFAYFAGGGNIGKGERAQDDAIFFKLSSLSNVTLSYELSWLDLL